MDEWARMRHGLIDPADILRSNAAKLVELLTENPEDPESINQALAAIHQALEKLNGSDSV